MLETELEQKTTETGPPPGPRIAGLGVALPERVVTNAPIAERLGVKPDWITKRTGVRERRVADPDVTLVDMATQAARAALDDAGFAAESIDLLLLATSTNEMLCPAGGPVVAANIGADRAGAFDLNSACNGFLSGLSLAASQIETGRANNVLVIGADMMQRFIDQDDRTTAGIFADGGGAVVMAGDKGPGRIGPVVLGADGGSGHLVQASRKEAITRMKGHETFQLAVDKICESTTEAMALAGCEQEEIDLFVYHQANARILASVGDRLGLPAEKVVECIDRFGNTSSGSLPIALNDAREDGLLNEGDKVLIGAFGGGMTWGATVIEWGRREA
ncbi:MAG: ketoacyl-ACP synthase III [Thermoleophilia bacterium]|nr:ketoacyl-ACP synthase III [Thermoleophilia bacterium]